MNPRYLLTINTAYIQRELTMTTENITTLLKFIVSAVVSFVTVAVSVNFEKWIPSSTYRLWRLTRRSETVVAEMESSRNDLNRFSFGLVANAINRKIAHKSFRRMLGPNGGSRVFSGWGFTTPGCLFASLLLAGPSDYAFWRFCFLLLFPENPKDPLPDAAFLFFVLGLTGECASLMFAIPLSRHFIGSFGINEFVDPFFNKTYAVKGAKGTLIFCRGLLERIYTAKTVCICRDMALCCFVSVFFMPIPLLIRQRWGQQYHWAVVAEYIFSVWLILLLIFVTGVEIGFRFTLHKEKVKAKKDCSWIEHIPTK